jgi:hypothetical protein
VRASSCGFRDKGVREMSDLLDRTQREIAARLQELEPAVGEFERLQAAVAALDGLGGSTMGALSPRSRRAARDELRRRPGRPRGFKNTSSVATDMGPAVANAVLVVKAAPARKRHRRGARGRAGGGRGAQAVSLITERPGVTIGELAKRMGISRTYLYSVLPKLELEGRVSRRGSGWYLAEV